MKIKQAVFLFVILLLLAGVIASIFLKPDDMTRLGLLDQGGEPLGVATCDAAVEPCTFIAGGDRYTLFLTPPIRPLQPFSMRMTIEGSVATQVMATFTMADMEMGLNRFVLRQDGTVWKGDAVLPVCTDSRTDWLATVFVREAERSYQIVFPFTAQ